jgi:molecular chaperone GrpE (heat shock protein)
LRDWVLLAKSGESDNQASPKVLDAIYKQLGKILEKEGITPLEETGSFNYERQQVISTEATDDPEKDDLICDTIRLGYLFKGILFRPQEVIVYKLNGA